MGGLQLVKKIISWGWGGLMLLGEVNEKNRGEACGVFQGAWGHFSGEAKNLEQFRLMDFFATS